MPGVGKGRATQRGGMRRPLHEDLATKDRDGLAGQAHAITFVPETKHAAACR